MKVAWIDVETTGLDCTRHGIIQVAIIVEIDHKIITRADYRMNPVGKEIDPEAMMVHGISVDELDAYPPCSSVKVKIESFLGQFVNKFDRQDKFVPAGYNVDFDLGFMEHLWLDNGDKYFYSWFERVPLDVYRDHRLMEYAGLARVPTNRKLETVAEMYGVAMPNSHDAAVDIDTTYKVAEIMLKKIKGEAV